MVTYPDSGTVSFVLDEVSRITRRTDQRGVNTDIDYDAMGRALTKREDTSLYWSRVEFLHNYCLHA